MELKQNQRAGRKRYPIALSANELYILQHNGAINGIYVKPWENKYFSKWTGIVSIIANDEYTIGLKNDGTLVHTGNKKGWTNQSYSGNMQQCIECWRDIVEIACGREYLVALRCDGRVLASTPATNDYNETAVSSWSNIVSISCGPTHTVGLRADGTVVATGNNQDGRCNVSEWRDIVAISAGSKHTLGLKADGTVVATKFTDHPVRYHGQSEVSSWRDIVSIAAGEDFSIGLKSDGSLIATSYIVTQDTFRGHLRSETRYMNPANREHNVSEIYGFNDNGVIVLRKDGTLTQIGGSDWFRINKDIMDFTNKLAQLRLYDKHIAHGSNNTLSNNIAIEDALRIARENPQMDHPQVSFDTKGTARDYYNSVYHAIEICQKQAGILQSKISALSYSINMLGRFEGNKRKLINERLNTLQVNKQNIENYIGRLFEEYDKRPLSIKISTAPVGSYVKFGSFVCDDSVIRPSVRPIQWIILEKRDDMALLLSVQCLSADSYGAINNKSWETSHLRKWLNQDFYKQAFTESEAQDILSVRIWTNDSTGNNATVDKLFCLSVEEAQNLLGSCYESTSFTGYAKSKLFSYSTLSFARETLSAWWLRSSGKNSECAACVWGDYISFTGNYDILTQNPSEIYLEAAKPTVLGVRPAMWVYIDKK